ncbi:hypothetical protein V6N11_071786 [Hibiscus sabdariffa]|uniref:RNase H type-1 domain-containing protein n=1 Tax=Hibiscus sabdariffa TaxID=183260 RepID=A0ABR2U1C1_9ROSI
MSVNDPPQHPADQSLGIVATSATSGASKPVVDNTPYGPWMGIILRENRFTAISMPDSSMGDDNDTNAPARPSSSDRVAPKAPLVFRAKQRVKGKSHVVFKGSSGTHIRKPLTLSNFPVLSRSSHKAGSSRSVPTNVVSLDASKHSVVVIGENSYPNIQQPMQQVSDLPPLQQHLLGDPPDCNPGTLRGSFIGGPWPILRANIAWSLGNGSLIRILDDIWLPQLGPLRDHLLVGANVCTFTDLIDASGEWDIDKLSTTFTAEAISHIINVKSPDSHDVEDMVIWRWSKRHNFEVSSAYSHITTSPWDGEDKIWDIIWKLTVPQRVRLFLWLAYRQRLMTNSERCRRGLGQSFLCPHCHMAEETVLHTLRDCTELTTAWLHLLTPEMREVFFCQDLHTWLRADAIIQKCLVWARYYTVPPIQFSVPVHRMERTDAWTRPPFGWICLNVDGAVLSSSCMGSAGGLFRDTDRRWLSGFNKFLGVTSPLFAKLWAICIGLKVAWDNGFEYVQVQSDYLEAVRLLQDHNLVGNNLSLVRAIDSYRNKCWATELIWIPRVANKPADSLAKFVDSLHPAISILEEPPDFLMPLLAADTSVSPS